MIKKNTNIGPTQRQLRVGEEVRHALSSIFIQEPLYEAELVGKSITVSEVRMSPDLKNATAFVMPLGGRAGDKFIKALNDKAGFFRQTLPRYANLRYLPKISFKYDNSFEVAGEIERLLQVAKEDPGSVD